MDLLCRNYCSGFQEGSCRLMFKNVLIYKSTVDEILFNLMKQCGVRVK